MIIFITAAPQYAISGYEVRALSYLLKPLPWFAFSQELKKSIDMVRRNGDDSMLIETGKGQMRMNLTDILYLESIRHTIVIHTLDGKYSINGTLKDMEAKLADRHFFPLELLLSGQSQACDGRCRPGLHHVRRRAAAREQTTEESVPRRLGRLHGRRPMITNALPDIPRSYTAICEWAACVCISRYCSAACRRAAPSL